MSEPTQELVSTEQAAEMLGVKPSTIYTYVTRGLLESIRKPGVVASWFDPSEIERLAAGRRSRRTADVRSTPPEVVTAITELGPLGYHYRGLDPERLADEYSFEQVAEFLWTGSLPDRGVWKPTQEDAARVVADAALGADALPLDRLRVAVSVMAASDHLRLGRQSGALIVTARQLMANMVASLPVLGSESETGDLASRLWPRLTAQPPSDERVRVLDKALVVIADHGIAPSTLAARVAATYRADLYGTVETGLAIVAGSWYGGRALSAETMLDDINRVGDAEMVVGELLRLGSIPCLGQPRYDGPDPRTGTIVGFLDEVVPDAGPVLALRDITRITTERALPAPSVELALATLARAFDFTKGASEAIFAIGRAAGWIAHAMEVYGRPSAKPPESVYRGLQRVMESGKADDEPAPTQLADEENHK